MGLVNGTVPDLKVKGLIAGNGINLTDDPDCVTIGTTYSRISLQGLGGTIANNSATIVSWASIIDNVGTYLTFNGTDTITINTSGLYIFDSTINFEENTTGVRSFDIILGGAVIADTMLSAAPAGFQWRNNLSVVQTVTAGDTFKVRVYQNSGGDLPLAVHFASVTRLF